MSPDQARDYLIMAELADHIESSLQVEDDEYEELREELVLDCWAELDAESERDEKIWEMAEAHISTLEPGALRIVAQRWQNAVDTMADKPPSVP